MTTTQNEEPQAGCREAKVNNYGLLKCWPVGVGSANRLLAECEAENIIEAIVKLQPSCPAKLDATGYVKVNEKTYVVAEAVSNRA